VFPPKVAKQTRKRGERKPQMAFRAPGDIQSYVEAAEDGGYVKSQVIIEMLRVAKEVAENLGTEWYEVERLAKLESSTPGKVLASLVHEALKKRASRKP
jgi:hypothetical protein